MKEFKLPVDIWLTYSANII